MIRNPAHTQVARPRSQSLPTYSDEDFARMAEAIGEDLDVCRLLVHQKEFESVALWYELDTASTKRIAPSKIRKKLERTAAAARKLLIHLAVRDPAAAPDGPGDITILDVLASVDGETEDSVTRATARVENLVEILECIEATRKLERLAVEAITDVTRLGDLTVPKEHRGDAAINDWLACVMSIYVKVTGEDPATSVGAPGQPDEGIARGPLIRFLEASGAPLGIEYASDAWRSRVRTILDNASGRN